MFTEEGIMRGRYPAGLECMDELDGEAEEKQRLRLILKTLSGQARLLEACEQLGIGETRFRQLRARALRGALDGLKPKPLGRPSLAATPTAERLRELEQLLAEKDLALQQALVREEVALILPQRGEIETGKKGRRSNVKLRRQKPR